jgi:hypothetical protein
MAIVLGYKKEGEFVQECFNTSFELERRYKELVEKFDGFDFEFLKEYGTSSYNSKLIKDLTTETQNRKEEACL